MKQQEDNYLDDLQQLRQQLDTIDQEIMKLLIQRFHITDEVGILKARNNKSVVDTVREHEILENIKIKIRTEGQHEGNQNAEYLAQSISEIYKTIMNQSKLKQEALLKASHER